MYKGLFSTIKQYWTEYGGLGDFLRSPFTHFSFGATTLYGLGYIEVEWREIVIGSLPTVLGFSLAAYTITFTLMGSALHRALTNAKDPNTGLSLIRVVNSTFFHVIVFQALALIYALLSKGTLIGKIISYFITDTVVANWINQKVFYLGDVVGCFLAIYSFFLLLSVGIAMFRLGRITPPVKIAQSANDDDNEIPEDREITETKRFKFIVWLSKRIGLYK